MEKWEVERLIREFREEAYCDLTSDMLWDDVLFDKWIQENLYKEEKKTIAVISYDEYDFRNWVRDMWREGKLVSRKLETEDTIYYCITQPCDLCSIGLDFIVQTENSVKNENYCGILEIAKSNLK